MNKENIKKYLLPNLPYLFPFWLTNKLGEAYRLSNIVDNFSRAVDAINGLAALGQHPFPSFHPKDLLVGAIGAVLVRVAVYFKGKNTKKYRKGVEYGSARWSA